MVRKYLKVAVGGTFDLLHKGHICLIKKALELGDSVAIGLTTEELLKVNPKNHFTENFDARRTELIRFVTSLGALNRVQIVPLRDSYGPTITDRELEALVVSYETINNVGEINKIRHKKGFKPLEIVVLDAVFAEDGLPISTTRIRRGEIDRAGRLMSEKNVS
jgi:pantetheine-phosphate adenylyltransferase